MAPQHLKIATLDITPLAQCGQMSLNQADPGTAKKQTKPMNPCCLLRSAGARPYEESTRRS
jgi:hypothetical protein